MCTMESDNGKDSTSTGSNTSGSDTDGSVSEKCLFISSAANIRRRELHGQARYYQEEESVEVKKKKKLTKKRQPKKVNLGSLKEMKEKIKEAIEVDSRGLKKKNPKRAVASVEKWQDSGI